MGALGTLVWVIAGVLAGLTAVLSRTAERRHPRHADVQRRQRRSCCAPSAAAVLARMERPAGVAIAAAIGIAIFERCVFWVDRTDTAPTDVVLLAV